MGGHEPAVVALRAVFRLAGAGAVVCVFDDGRWRGDSCCKGCEEEDRGDEKMHVCFGDVDGGCRTKEKCCV